MHEDWARALLRREERKFDLLCETHKIQNERWTKIAGISGIVLMGPLILVYHSGISALFVGLTPTLLVMGISILLFNIACRKHLRVCIGIIDAWEDDPDPNDNEEVLDKAA